MYHPELNQRYKITTCGYCHADFFYTDKDQLSKHKTCMSKPKPIQREFTMNQYEYDQMLLPYVNCKFNPVQLKLDKLEGFSDQESNDIIQKAFTLQKLKYRSKLDASQEITACIKSDNYMWILGSRFTFDHVIQSLSNPCNYLYLYNL